MVCLFRRLSYQRKRQKLRVTGFCEGNSLMTGEFPSQKPVTWNMFPFDDVIMIDLNRPICVLGHIINI